ncbi:Acetoacetyl-CoA synthetase [Plecturocebus cupreus]
MVGIRKFSGAGEGGHDPQAVQVQPLSHSGPGSQRNLLDICCLHPTHPEPKASSRVLPTGYLPNSEHAVEAMLAAASIGAIWSSTSPDFGVNVSQCLWQRGHPVPCEHPGQGQYGWNSRGAGQQREPSGRRWRCNGLCGERRSQKDLGLVLPFFSKMESCSVAQAGVNSPASSFRVAEITGAGHHALLVFVFLVEIQFYHIGQAGLELLTL